MNKYFFTLFVLTLALTGCSINDSQDTLKKEYLSLLEKHNLRFNTYEDAVRAFKEKVGADIEPSSIAFYVPGKYPRRDGNPYFILDATTSFNRSSFFNRSSLKKDYCYLGWFSLVDNNTKFRESYCGSIE